MSQIILLNGLSSAGKTTIAKALQAASPTDLLRIGIDDYISMIPPGRETGPDWFFVESRVEEGKALTRFDNAALGAKLMSAMRTNIAHIAGLGFHLVVDDVCTAAEIAEYRALLANHTLHIVAVDAPLSVIENRERERGDRQIGLARYQSTHLHHGIDYDLKIDTNCTTTREAVNMIIAELL